MFEYSKSLFEEKVHSIFQELVGEKANELRGNRLPKRARELTTKALSSKFDEKTAARLALHFTDWNSEAAFIVCLCLFPEKFSDAEIVDGIQRFLVHAPNHILEACRLTDTVVWDDWPYDE